MLFLLLAADNNDKFFATCCSDEINRFVIERLGLQRSGVARCVIELKHYIADNAQRYHINPRLSADPTKYYGNKDSEARVKISTDISVADGIKMKPGNRTRLPGQTSILCMDRQQEFCN